MKYERESTRDEWIPREVKRARARIHKESHGALYFVSRVLQCRATAYTLEAGTRLSQLGHPVWVGARLPAEHLHTHTEREREIHTHAFTHSHTHTHARAHAHTHTHTHSHTQSHTPLLFAQCCTSRLGRACLMESLKSIFTTLCASLTAGLSIRRLSGVTMWAFPWRAPPCPLFRRRSL